MNDTAIQSSPDRGADHGRLRPRPAPDRTPDEGDIFDVVVALRLKGGVARTRISDVGFVLLSIIELTPGFDLGVRLRENGEFQRKDPGQVPVEYGDGGTISELRLHFHVRVDVEQKRRALMLLLNAAFNQPFIARVERVEATTPWLETVEDEEENQA